MSGPCEQWSEYGIGAQVSRSTSLSSHIAHCYVSHTSTARGISLGILPASERAKTLNVVGPNQPHFELMGLKIPVMQIDGEEWRGISEGEVVGPEKVRTL